MNKHPRQIRPPSTGDPPRISREKTIPLHELAHVCCSTGACRSAPYWPVEIRQDGWLQLDDGEGRDIAVDLIAFSSRGVSVVMSAAQPIRQGTQGVLITQAHGAGCRHQPVVCCWHRPHPHNHERQCVGLRFVHPAP